MELDEMIALVKQRRESLRITQETLADLSGIGLRTLKQLESGKGNPTWLTLQKLAQTLGLELTMKVKKTNYDV